MEIQPFVYSNFVCYRYDSSAEVFSLCSINKIFEK